MQTPRYFTGEDCSTWLYQMMQVNIAAYSWKYYPEENLIEGTDTWKLDKTELYDSCITLGVSSLLMTAYIC